MHRSKQHRYSITSSARASSAGGTSNSRPGSGTRHHKQMQCLRAAANRAEFGRAVKAVILGVRPGERRKIRGTGGERGYVARDARSPATAAPRTTITWDVGRAASDDEHTGGLGCAGRAGDTALSGALSRSQIEEAFRRPDCLGRKPIDGRGLATLTGDLERRGVPISAVSLMSVC